LTLGFVSDLHIGPTTPFRLLENAVSVLDDEKPDVVVFGGDYVFLDASPAKMKLLEGLLAGVRAPFRIAVRGNHDIWTNSDEIVAAFSASGVRVLVNESVRLPAPWDDIAIAGLDEPRAGYADAAKALSATANANVRIGVCHSPQGALDLLGKVDLFLAGHTHGGQIAFPGGTPIILPKGEGCRRWSHGRYVCNGTRIIVSRGVGCTELPIRLFARPEVVILTLTSGRAVV
jgi:predicted MPP superfamily phosphohydrolase